ncbi:MAG: cupin domain-containing protein [Ilumatobacteraceae bacterium]|nr:cupin domain-containing protein [Ilumatobacteraceae bacterium]
MSTLAALVGDVDRFGREVWGTQPLRTGDADLASPVPLTLADVDRIITSSARVPAIRLVRGGRRVPSADFCSPTRIGSTTLRDVADAAKVLDEYRRGATIVLQSLQRTWSPMSTWCAELEAEIGWPVQCNAYLTPPGTSGLRRHADGHDVFVVQTHGSKHWDVDGLGEFELRVGEVLYLPAGVHHDASTHDRPSLHVTVGVHRPGPSRLVRAALDRLEVTAPPVPIGRSAPLSTTLSAALDGVRRALADVDADEVERAVRRPARRDPGGIIERAVTRGPIDEHTGIELVAASDPIVEQAGERVRCRWNGGSLTMPGFVAPALVAIADSDGPDGDRLEVGDLPGLDTDDRLVLVRRLADEGLIVLTT